MKTILRILTILLIGALVSGGIYLILQNTTLASDVSGGPSLDQMPATVDGELSQPPARPEGDTDRNGASLERGLSEVLVSLAKLTGITVIVLLVQAVIANLRRWKVARPAPR
jgi:hypothetical protein